MADDGTTPPSGEDLLSSIRRLVTLREAEALVLTGAQRINDHTADDGTSAAEDGDAAAWLARINTATSPERDADDPFAHRAPATRAGDDSWPALSKESLGLVRAGIDFPDDDFEDDEEPVWSGSIMRQAAPPVAEPEPEAPSEPFLLTDPAVSAPPVQTAEPPVTDPPLPLTDRIPAAEPLWDDVDKLAERLSSASGAAPAPHPTDADPAPVPVPDQSALPPALAGEELNALVAAIVREELRGELGIRITRNVRKLVRREIYRAIANGELTRE